MVQRKAEIPIQSPQELSKTIRNFRTAHMDSLMGNEPFGSLETLLQEDGLENCLIEQLTTDPTLAQAIILTGGELLQNLAHGLIGGSELTPQEVADPQAFGTVQPRRSLLEQAFNQIQDQQLPPPLLTMIYDDETGKGSVEVSHPVLPGLSSPPFDREMLERRNEEIPQRRKIGGIKTIEEGAIATLFQQTGHDVGQVEGTDSMGMRVIRFLFGD